MESANQQSKTINRQELFELVWQLPATRLAEQFNIPYSDFKKICDSISVPIPGSGYWSKLRAGKPVPKTILPADYSGHLEVTIEPALKKQSVIAPLLEKEGYVKQKSEFKVPAKLTNPDKLIVAVKEHLEKKMYLDNGLACSHSGFLNFKVSPKNIARALRFMDTLIKALKQRGHDMVISYGSTYAVVEDQKIEISLREKLNRTMEKGTHWDTARYTPCGILVFKMDKIWAKEWKDGKYSLEEYLPEIISRLEKKGKEEKERHLSWQKEQEKRQERERVQRELEARQEKELTRFKTLLQDAKRWKEVKILREYITDMGSESSTKETNPEEHAAWLSWAKEKANWYDPQVNAKDELLDAVDKETLTLKKKSGYYGW